MTQKTQIEYNHLFSPEDITCTAVICIIRVIRVSITHLTKH